MIQGIHGMFYSAEADALRAFIRDKLRLPHTDVGGGWLIFDFPRGDLGCHPTDHPGSPPSGTHNLSFFCDDIEGTVAELKSRGVVFDAGVHDAGYGLVTYFTMPGGVKVELYEPRYAKPSVKATKKKAPAKGVKRRVTATAAATGRKRAGKAAKRGAARAGKGKKRR